MNSLDVRVPFVVLLGPPASGKSTLAAELLRQRPLLGHFAVRRQFVKEKDNDTDLWRRARPFMERGKWIPDDIVIESFARRMGPYLRRGMLIEGLPGNAAQARLLRELLDSREVAIQLILYLQADDETCMARMRGRQVCAGCDGGISQAAIDPHEPGVCAACGAKLTRRHDDEAEAFADRLRIHRHHIAEITTVYGRSSVHVIDGCMAPDNVLAAATRLLREETRWGSSTTSTVSS